MIKRLQEIALRPGSGGWYLTLLFEDESVEQFLVENPEQFVAETAGKLGIWLAAGAGNVPEVR